MNFLKENICYNQLTARPLSKITSADFSQSVYDHAIRAIESVKINGYGLIDKLLPSFIMKDELLNNICSSLLYCASVERFFDYIEYKAKLRCIGRITRIRQAAANKAIEYYKQSGNKLYYALHMLAGKKHICGQYDITLNNGYQCLIYALAVLNTNPKYALKILNNYLSADITPLQHILLKIIIFNGFFGIKFKCGHLGVTPKAENFRLQFNRENIRLTIEADKRNNRCCNVNGIILNNVDYINLRSYNKDIYLKL
jgi:hypothetical protein